MPTLHAAFQQAVYPAIRAANRSTISISFVAAIVIPNRATNHATVISAFIPADDPNVSAIRTAFEPALRHPEWTTHEPADSAAN